ncbi:MAG: UbiA family prenyltransferase [Crocinitomicaceae bacterium]|nr:UbiA family prenyltransferase [Crocinitomicaceae bacterium]
MPIFILALSQSPEPNVFYSILSFLIIHLLVYPASNGYNSYIDKDETSIGGLEKPPMPTKALFYLTLVMDSVAILLSFIFIHWIFAVCILAYILASRAYSSKQIRLKKYPLIGFLIVVVFQGAFTYYMSNFGINGTSLTFSSSDIYIMLACSLQIAGAYPLTQIYQHEADLADGVTTLSYKLGYKGTFIFTGILFFICTIFYFLYFQSIGSLNQFFILLFFFAPILVFFNIWFIKTMKNLEEANFKNTMRMNAIASICMSSCFIILTVLNHSA